MGRIGPTRGLLKFGPEQGSPFMCLEEVLIVIIIQLNNIQKDELLACKDMVNISLETLESLHMSS